jgi:hypothetical protein
MSELKRLEEENIRLNGERLSLKGHVWALLLMLENCRKNDETHHLHDRAWAWPGEWNDEIRMARALVGPAPPHFLMPADQLALEEEQGSP